MDEKEYQAAYRDRNPRPCVFEKALLSRCVGCSQARKIHIAVREAAGCGTESAQADCTLFKELLKRNARFVLQLHDLDLPLPHAKDLRMQCGGLEGLRKLMRDPSRDPSLPENDVRAWVMAGKNWFGGLDSLPYQQIAREIARFHPRRRRSDR